MSTGYPDGQKITQWIGAPIAQDAGVPIGAGQIVIGPTRLASWASVIVALKATAGAITITVSQEVPNGPAGLAIAEQVVVPAGGTVFQSFVLFGANVTITLQGAVAGTVADYAITPSNTTTNAQVLTNATIDVQQNEALVAAEPTLDFVDAGAAKWTITDDAPNTRVKIAMPKVITGVVSGAGVLVAGTGFTPSRTAVGRYTITFATAFAVAPVLVPVSLGTTGSEIATIGARTAAAVDVQIVAAGAFVDREFYFEAHAVG